MRARGARRGDRLRVAVLLGGPSSEHEVSLDGGAKVVNALDPARFEVRPLVISRDGQWRLPGWRRGEPFDARRPGRDAKSFAGPLQALAHLAEWPADVVVPILHGRFGEDGTVQACLHAAGLPFVGSGAVGSALAFDKARSKEVMRFHGIPTPDFEMLDDAAVRRQPSVLAGELVGRLGLPLVLKNPRGGSSLEVRIANDEGEMIAAFDELGGVDETGRTKRIMAERFVRGRELTAGVLEDREKGEPVALPIVEIRPRTAGHFDYQEKYSADGAEELCPAPLKPDEEAEARRLGLAMHRAFGLRGLSRTDLILDEAGALWVLEVNTLPGMTERGLVPKAAQGLGIGFAALIERLVHGAAVP